MADVSAPEFWEEHYAQPRQMWELGGPTPALVDVIEATDASPALQRAAPGLLTWAPPRGRVAVPGCGRAHDVRYLVERGYEAVGFDFSPAALRHARTLARISGVAIELVQMDVFELARHYAGAFDGVWEYTCYCAIDPSRRAEYLANIDAILKPAGWFLACFFPLAGEWKGPPFVVDRDEVRRLLAPAFRVEREWAPPRSAPGRQGMEWMVYAVKRG